MGIMPQQDVEMPVIGIERTMPQYTEQQLWEKYLELTKELLKYTPYVKVVTKFHNGMENKEDITDYFTKYNRTKEELINCIEETDWFTPEDVKEEENRHYPIMDLLSASRPENLNKTVRSNVQIESISEPTFSCPSKLTAEKFKATESGAMLEGEIREWELTEDNCGKILKMIDSNIKEDIFNFKVPSSSLYDSITNFFRSIK